MWWMTQRMGYSGRDIPFETQFLVVEGTNGAQFAGDSTEQPVVYTVFLPILEGSFRAVLQGNADDELEICLESGNYGNHINITPLTWYSVMRYNSIFVTIIQVIQM
jgi:raffinose synthase